MARRPLRSLLTAGLSVLLGAASVPAETWLRDVTDAAGLDFVHVRAQPVRFWLPEIMSGGACWLDYDRDGDADLYLVQGGALGPPVADAQSRWRNELYRNDGPAGFSRKTLAAGVGDSSYGMGCAVGDVDGDGWTDLYVTNVGPNVLYRNRGDGTFEPAAESAGVGDGAWGSSAAFLDHDLDGDLDLFVVNYVEWSPDKEIECFTGGLRDYCHPDRYDAPTPDRLYRNRGDGTFEDASQPAGLRTAFGNGLGVAVGDVDADGLPDVYVANDGMPNQLWRNQGDGTFRDVALLAGVAVNRVGEPEAGMGVQAFDVDTDGSLDLFVTHLRSETNTLYSNDGAGLFSDRTATSGLGASSLGFTGFGTGFADFDADGVADLFVANGRIGLALGELATDPFAEPDHLYRGLGGGRFVRLEAQAIDSPLPVSTSRAAAFADADSDGDVDVVVVANGGPARLLRNVVETGDAWLAARVLDSAGADAVGARLTLSAGDRRQLRLVQPAYSYCAASESRVHFGLGRGDGELSLAVSAAGQRQRLFRGPPRGAVLVVPHRSLGR